LIIVHNNNVGSLLHPHLREKVRFSLHPLRFPLTPFRVLLSGWKHKPLKDWTKRDLNDWLQSNEDFKVLSEKNILSGYTGETLEKTTEEKIRDLIRDNITFKILEPKHLALVEPLFNAIQHLKQEGNFFLCFLFQLLVSFTFRSHSFSSFLILAQKAPVERLTPSVRDSLQEFEKWSHLHASNLDKLKVGEFIKLPDLGERPKELGGPLQKMLLTQQRLDHIKEVAKELKFGQEEFSGEPSERGRILSGPNGIGKTVLSYLTAAFAWANGAIILYIVCFYMLFHSYYLFKVTNLTLINSPTQRYGPK